MSVENENLPVEPTTGSENDHESGSENEIDLDFLNQSEEDSEDDDLDIDEDESEEEEHHTSKKSKGVQTRINKLTAEKYRMAEELKELRSRLDDLASGKVNKPEPTVEVSEKPKLEDFDYDQEAYLDALSDWKIEQKLKTNSEQTEARKANEAKEAEFNKNVAAYNERVSKSGFKDYKEVVSNIPVNVPLAEDTAKYIIESDLGPQLTYYFGKNPEKWKELSKLGTGKQVAEIVRIENAIKAKTSIKKQDLPDPLSPTKPKGSVKKTKGFTSLKDFQQNYRK